MGRARTFTMTKDFRHSKPTFSSSAIALLLIITFACTPASGQSNVQNFTSAAIPENVNNGIDLFNLVEVMPNRHFTILNNSVAGSSLFDITNQGKLILQLDLPENKRKLFDYETHPLFFVNILATNKTNPSDERVVRVIIPLTDVNDEKPKFVTEPRPYYAAVSESPAPGTTLFTITATDPDTDPQLDMIISSVEPPLDPARFTLVKLSEQDAGRTISYKLNTVGTGPLPVPTGTQEYTVGITVTDWAAYKTEQTEKAYVKVKVGKRPPQIFENGYTGTITETSGTNYVMSGTIPLEIKVKQFQSGPLKFEILQNGRQSGLFTFQNNRQIVNKQPLSVQAFGNPQPLSAQTSAKTVSTTVTIRVTENAESPLALSSTAELTVKITADNNHTPKFSLNLYTETVPEDVPVGTTVLTVQASDQDSGEHGILTFSVSDDNFKIETVYNQAVQAYQGHIVVVKPLDYDRIEGPMYSFSVIATDNGEPPNTASANVAIITTNVNDNAPVVSGSNETQRVLETASAGVIFTVDAKDLDGDELICTFISLTPFSSRQIFTVGSDCKVNYEGGLDRSVDTYYLTINVSDTGSCCSSSNTKSTQVTYRISVEGLNSNVPEFPNCTSYSSTSVKEESPIGTSVLTVKAVDVDRGENGKVYYYLSQPDPASPNAEFTINNLTGLITVKKEFNRTINREYIQVTVIGRNLGTRLMEKSCSFRVLIIDINNNPPTFSLQEITVTATRNKIFTTREYVTSVRATDKDFGSNANITYTIDSDDYFSINPVTGMIYLQKALPEFNGIGQEQYILTVTANDNGLDPGPLNSSVRLTILFTEADNIITPTWSNIPTTPITIQEVTQPNVWVTTLYCNPNMVNDAGVEFLVYETDIAHASSNFKAKTGVKENGRYKMDLMTMKQAYELKNYTVIVNCRNRGSNGGAMDISLSISVQDVNDKIPVFQGTTGCCYMSTIMENAQAGTSITEVSATDADRIPPFNEVSFSIEHPSTPPFFFIENLGNNRAIVTVTAEFANVLDRETQDFYEVEVKAQDGAPSFYPNQNNSATRSIRLIVLDVNDVVPHFDHQQYNCSANETLRVGEPVCIVKANDPDLDDEAGLFYYFENDNRSAFSISQYSGQITVRRDLDYESTNDPKIFDLTLVARDQAGHTSTTQVRIHIVDMNDNPPVFTKPEYVVRNKVTEHDLSITPENPLQLDQVNATDKDVGRSQTNIRYSLMGSYTSGQQQKFTIDPITGIVSLIGPLDREENLDHFYIFQVKAEDEPVDPQAGYATIKVFPSDINDQHPEFINASLQATVLENSPPDESIGHLSATDADEGNNAMVSFRKLATQDSQYASYFRITEKGDIITNPGAVFDREILDHITVAVEAYDGGTPSLSSTATLTVSIKDINDNSPEFDQRQYSFDISENIPIGTVVETITATDRDIDPENKILSYSVSPNGFFTVQDGGKIVLEQRLDYEANHREVNFNITVRDSNPDHTDTASVHFAVLDYNDEPPVFERDLITVNVTEEEPPGQYIATFVASDADVTPPNNVIEYSVVPQSDVFFEFFIDPSSGNVTTRKPLDYEKGHTRTILIMAKDKGEIPLNSTATLFVYLVNKNDNAPQLNDYRPVVEENVPYSNQVVEEVTAFDPDDPPFGGPFHFRLPDNCNVPACREFSLEYNRNGDSGQGSAIIRTSSTFDREAQKEYHLPIIIRDMYNVPGAVDFLSATSTLTIVVGDKNDNRHGPGHQNIFVYVKGDKSTERTKIGRVYAPDLDDWDLPDKTFTNLSPETMGEYFILDGSNGEITLKENVPVNEGRQPYNFQVQVYDNVFGNTETCTVSVTVATLVDQAIQKAGTVRLAGITADDFILKPQTGLSKFDMFQNQMSTLLGYPVNQGHVKIVSLSQIGDDLDVRFAAHGSPYHNQAQIESAILLFQPQFESTVGVRVSQVPVNLCTEEVYLEGCYTYANVTGNPSLVNSNGTSFVGAEVIMTAMEGCVDCLFPETNECTGDYCYNGGTCTKDDWGILSCSCLEGFDGPRCQKTHHSFSGNSVAFYHSLESCATGRTSIEFITEQDNGIILYSGPVSNTDQPFQDYFVLELVGGYPKLHINLGFGEALLTMTGTNQAGNLILNKLSDGQWHRIDIDKTYQEVTMTVDHCQVAQAQQDGQVPDWSPCRVRARLPGGDILLNSQSLLQLGGRYPDANPPASPVGVGVRGFNGCLRNLMHNTKLYDLAYQLPGWSSGMDGCPKEESICGSSCGQNAWCESRWMPTAQVSKCTCHPGWYGENCAQEAPVRDIQSETFLKWSLVNSVVQASQRDLDIDIMFRTRQLSGNLFTVTTVDQAQILLMLMNGHLSVSYNFGLGPQTLTLSNTMVNTGQWHQARMIRRGNEITLALDGGEGRCYGYTSGSDTGKVEVQIQPYISSGANLPAVSERVQTGDIIDNLVSSCVRDIRLNGNWLPMTLDTAVDGATLVETGKPLPEVCTREDCQPNPCREGQCRSLWEDHLCWCPGNLVELITGQCPSLCTPNPCFNDVPCIQTEDTFTCECPSGWSGQLCNALAVSVAEDDAMNGGVIAAIVIAVILLVIAAVLLLMFFLYCRGKSDETIVGMDPDDDFIRENVMFYDEEGAGEKDHQGYNIEDLYVPDEGHQPQYDATEVPFQPDRVTVTHQTPVWKSAPQVAPHHDVDNRPNVGKFIDQRIAEAEDPNSDPLNDDSLREYNYEGGSSVAGSLSSLNSEDSTDSSQDYDFLNDWGDKFAGLADLYGAGQTEEQYI